jgi:hypothetical protein
MHDHQEAKTPAMRIPTLDWSRRQPWTRSSPSNIHRSSSSERTLASKLAWSVALSSSGSMSFWCCRKASMRLFSCSASQSAAPSTSPG